MNGPHGDIPDKKKDAPVDTGASAPCPGAPATRKPDKIPYRKMYRWGWRIISYAPLYFFTFFALSIIGGLLYRVILVIFSVLTDIINGVETTGFVGQLLPHNLAQAGIIFIAVGFVYILVDYLSARVDVISDNLIIRKLTQQLHDKLLTLGPTYHNKHKLGETMTISSQYTTGAQMLLTQVYATPITSIILTAAGIFPIIDRFSQIKDFPSGMKFLMVILLLGIPIVNYILASRLRSVYSKVRDSELAVADEFTNSVTLPLEVQLMGAQKQRAKSYSEKLAVYFRDKIRAANRLVISSQFQGKSELLLRMILIVTAIYYYSKTGDRGLTGTIIMSWVFVPQIVSPVQQIISFIAGINTSWPMVEKVITTLEMQPDVQEKTGAVDLETQDTQVTLKNVTFSYVPGGAKILDDLSYSFEEGKITAIVARAGGGKSTVLNLVARLRDPQGGAIYIGEKDIRDVTLESFRKKVFKVSQFPLFIADTIRANMLLAEIDATDDEIKAVCRETGLWQVLENAAPPGTEPLDYILPSSVSEGLSGGQRRLLSVTRGLLPKPSIFLIDEPTTGIDAISVQDIVNAVSMASEGRTVLLVDHNMDFIERVADYVCCLEDGKFTDVGTPEELKQRPSLFKALLKAREDIMDDRHPVEAGTSPMGEAGPSDIRQKGDMTSPGSGEMDFGVIAGKVPEVADVEGQADKWLYMRCPHCGTMNMIQDEPGSLNIYRCWSCHFDFK